MSELSFEEKLILPIIWIVGLIALFSPLVNAGTESFDYQINVSVIACQLINGSLTGCSFTVETGGTIRPFNSTQTYNQTFLGTLIANVSELSCQKLICNLNQTVYVNNTCADVTVQPAVCPADPTPICPTGTTCQAIAQIPIETEDEESSNGLYMIGGILVIVGYFWWKKKKEGEKKNEPETEEPRTERKPDRVPGG